MLPLIRLRNLYYDPRGGLVYVFAAVFMSYVEIKLNREPFDAFH